MGKCFCERSELCHDQGKFLESEEITWEDTQEKVTKLENTEQLVKDEYSVFKNSANRKLELRKISEKMEEPHLQMRGIFEIKYLTSEESALRAALVDYEQMMVLSSDGETEE